MSTPIISVENLSKAYRIGVKEQKSDTLIGAAKSLLVSPYRNLKRLNRLNTSHAAFETPDASANASDDGSALDALPSRHEPDTLWALRDVSFDVGDGDVLGIIGRNGAGKSTLLKVLSRITEPTHGRATIRGRVSSLLEVGTGFHPELTGRENIYMNGTILGMSKREIDRKFDEIVDFSGVETFLDTPTKRYSSGMQVRLAFAVAAHLEPEILIIDEVLAVGDGDFQKKCIGKMEEVSRRGQTVLFVSHNMDAVSKLCTRCVLIESGCIADDSDTESIVRRYLSHSMGTVAKRIPESDRPGSGIFRITNVSVGDGDSPSGFSSGSAEKVIRFRIENRKESGALACVTVHLVNESGVEIVACDSRHLNKTFDQSQCPLETVMRLKGPWLKPGCYRVDLSIRSRGLVDLYEGAGLINIVPSIPFPYSAPIHGTKNALVYTDFECDFSNSPVHQGAGDCPPDHH